MELKPDSPEFFSDLEQHKNLPQAQTSDVDFIIDRMNQTDQLLRMQLAKTEKIKVMVTQLWVVTVIGLLLVLVGLFVFLPR